MFQLRDSSAEALIETGLRYYDTDDFSKSGYQSSRTIPFTSSGISPKSQVQTRDGPVAASELRAGMDLMTRDNGLQPAIWTGRNRNSADFTGEAPIRIRPGAMGKTDTGKSLIVAPGQTLLVWHALNELLFGSEVVFCRADHLLHIDGIDRAPRAGVNWCHILMASHQVINVDGIWVEPLQPDMAVFRMADEKAAGEILRAAPKLGFEHGISAYVSDYQILNKSEAGLLEFP